MDCSEEERLDRIYLTIDDFLISKHCRPETIDQSRSLENCELHFNKPGFDMAVIITDKSLISTIDEFHLPFQTDLGLITHTIYLPDVSRLKFCIRDLKKQEILYAIIVSEKNKAADKFDLFILNNLIELQKDLPYEDAIELVKSDFSNYMEVLKVSQKNNTKYPHARSGHIEGFIEPSNHIRYLLCLLFDNRMLKFQELQDLKAFVRARRSAIEALGGSSVNYAINDRPIPAYRQEKLKYYAYSLNDDGRPPRTSENKKPTNIVNARNTSRVMQESRVITSNADKAYSLPAIGKPIVAAVTRKPDVIAGNAAPKSAIITAAPVLYGKESASKPAGSEAFAVPPPPTTSLSGPPIKNLFAKPHDVLSHPLRNKVMAQPSPNKTVQQAQRLAASRVSVAPTSSPPVSAAGNAVASKRKIQFAMIPSPKPPPISHSTVANRQHSESLVNETNDTSNLTIKEIRSIISDINHPQSVGLKSAPLNSLKNSAIPSHDQGAAIAIDLTDETPESGEFSGPSAKKSKPGYSTVNMPEKQIVSPYKPQQMSSNAFVNLFKFVINLSPLSLPPTNVVILLLKKCLLDMQRYIAEKGMKCAAIDIRASRTGGCLDIIKIIESLCNETIAAKHNVLDIQFMWQNFPRNISEDSITITFYKLMKIFELTKLVSTSNDILMKMVQKLQQMVNYNFHILDQSSFPSTHLDYFPEMFSEFFFLKEQLHNLNSSLPPPDPLCGTPGAEIDKTFVENKIKFVVGPLMEYFVSVINSVHYKLDLSTVEEIFWAVRTLRFCLRKICVRALPERLQRRAPRTSTGNIIDRSLELLNEINVLVKEVRALNCILFTKKHYDLISILLDFTIKVEKSVSSDSEADLFDKEFLIHLNPVQFVHEFSCNVKPAVLQYHPDTEIDVLKTALKNRWIDILHDAFKGVPPEPDGHRIAKEVAYLLPKAWGRHTFDEAVIEAAMLSYSHWEKLLTKDFARSRLLYADVRNNYLMWLTRHQLDHRKATEQMTANQRMLDAKILSRSS